MSADEAELLLIEQRRDRLFELTRRFQVGSVVTRARDGLMRARPMTLALLDPSAEELDFLTVLDADVVRDVGHDPMVGVIFQDARHHVAWSGRAQIDRERYRISHAWHPELERSFPEGPDDPRLALLVVRAIAAEYWSASVATGALRMMGVANASPLEEPRPDPRRHGVVVFGDAGLTSEW